MRISDWSSDVCSSDLCGRGGGGEREQRKAAQHVGRYRHPFFSSCKPVLRPAWQRSAPAGQKVARRPTRRTNGPELLHRGHSRKRTKKGRGRAPASGSQEEPG